jgi:hypothetical protein
MVVLLSVWGRVVNLQLLEFVVQIHDQVKILAALRSQAKVLRIVNQNSGGIFHRQH